MAAVAVLSSITTGTTCSKEQGTDENAAPAAEPAVKPITFVRNTTGESTYGG